MVSPCARPFNHLGSIHPLIRIGSPMLGETEWEVGKEIGRMRLYLWGAPWLESPMSARLPLNAPLRVTAAGAGGGEQGRTDVRERMDGTDENTSLTKSRPVT